MSAPSRTAIKRCAVQRAANGYLLPDWTSGAAGSFLNRKPTPTGIEL